MTSALAVLLHLPIAGGPAPITAFLIYLRLGDTISAVIRLTVLPLVLIGILMGKTH